MKFCFAFNAMVDQTYMPADKQEINVELGLIPCSTCWSATHGPGPPSSSTGYTDQVLAQRWPQVIERVKRGVEEGRYEIGTYTYTHPMLSLIPCEDVYRQMQVGLDLDQRVWGHRPVGTILPEGSWDPSLAKVFADVGIGWALLSSGAYLLDHPKPRPRAVQPGTPTGHPFDATVRVRSLVACRRASGPSWSTRWHPRPTFSTCKL